MRGDKAARKLIHLTITRSMGREVVHIKVGKDLQDFGVHKSLICHYSPYFKAAFTSGFEETSTGIMKLGDVDLDVFELFFYWLYTQRLNKWRNESQLSLEKAIINAGNESKQRSRIRTLLELYVFADMVQVPAIKNNCIKEYYEMAIPEKEYLTERKNLAYIWEHTNESDLIRKFMVDLIVWDVPEISVENNLSQSPVEVIILVIFAMKKIIGHARTESVQLEKRRPKFRSLPSLISPLGDLTKYYVKVKTENFQDGDALYVSIAEMFEEEYEVEDILDSKLVDGSLKYKVKLVGYSHDDQYYPADDFAGGRTLLTAFHQKYPRKPGPAEK
ncbi:77df6434-a89c-49e6-a664-b6a9ae784c83 [Sclerotinia trifoliorum]|uniref:77df6434-a89c-49e6-a664-b6a9ae784c83 n=1 Tax=Sclerotinia trifoliorum TaxID=28548 RepID=A0A8H2W4F6_9HELO|nr:77df6434-a89c-49e6-a664-b6a9ae784c83 [Sclerotinia trifoliorum]